METYMYFTNFFKPKTNSSILFLFYYVNCLPSVSKPKKYSSFFKVTLLQMVLNNRLKLSYKHCRC